MKKEGTTHRVRRAAAVAVATATALALGGCGAQLGGADGGAAADGEPIRIGYVTPQTGPLAGFGEADAFVLDQITAYFADNPITLSDDTTHPVEIITKDTQSNSQIAGEVATELILQDDVDLILVSSTPDTTNPVSDVCEANQVVCISTVAPWQAWYFGRGGTPDAGFDWTYHFFWGLEDAESVYSDIWAQAAPDATSVGLLLPNDADGGAWGDAATGFPPFITDQGLTPDFPGLYPNGTADFTAQISQFKANGDEILTAIPIPPDFTTFWKQAVQQGYNPKVATVAKAILFPSSVEALGDLGDNLSTEVWWAPSYPYSSSLTGESAADFAAAFEATGKQWTQPLGFAEALFEVAVAALEKSDGTGDSIREALSTLQVDTIVGPVDFTSGPVPNVSKTPLVGGQWRLQDDGSYELVIVSNADHPDIPTDGTPEPIDWSN